MELENGFLKLPERFSTPNDSDQPAGWSTQIVVVTEGVPPKCPKKSGLGIIFYSHSNLRRKVVLSVCSKQ